VCLSWCGRWVIDQEVEPEGVILSNNRGRALAPPFFTSQNWTVS
jgi:hypothetical protein